MKRLLMSSILVSTMLLSTASLVHANETGEDSPSSQIEIQTLSSENVFGDYYFYDGVITGYRGNGGDLVIPETINGQEVLRIDDAVFRGKGITSVVLPDTLLQIGANAFRDNGQLITMTIPASLQQVGSYWVSSTNLTVIHYKGTEYAWKDLGLSLSATVNYGNQEAKLTSAVGTTMPSVPATSPVDDFLFYDGVITGYRGNGGDIVIPTVINGQEVIRIDDAAFRGKGITSVVLPDTLLQIGANAFRDNGTLVSVTMPASIQSFGSYCFSGTNLDMINYKGDSYAWKDLNIASFSNLYRLGNQEPLITSASQTVAVTPGEVTISSDFISVEGIITEYRGDGGDIVIPSSHNGKTVWKIDTAAFRGKNITSVVLPDTLTEIASNAFRDNGNLISITIPTSLTTIGSYAFSSTNLDITNYKGNEYQWKELGYTTLGNLVRLNVGTALAPTTPVVGTGTTTTPSTPEPSTPSNDLVYATWAETFVSNAKDNNLLTDALGKDYTTDITRLQIADLLVNMIEKYTNSSLSEADSGTFSDTANSAVLKAYAAGLIGGKGNGMFAPFDTATRQEISIMMYNTIKKMEDMSAKSLINHSLTTVSGFSDFDTAASWSQNSLAILANAGIISGNGGKIDPHSSTSIQQALVMNQNIFQLGK